MKVVLHSLDVVTRRTSERVELISIVTYIHGPVSSGKSSVARLIDYCLGGGLERTPALRAEFVAARLTLTLGKHLVVCERGAEDGAVIRVTWEGKDEPAESVNAPLQAGEAPIYADAFNFSDLMFVLADVSPMKVRKNRSDPNSPLVRLSIRDIIWYCYLEQDHLDSTFFRLEDPVRKYKSRDVMRFVTGLYSERMSELEAEFERLLDAQRVERETVSRMREFMAQFQLANESDVLLEIQKTASELEAAQLELRQLDESRKAETHAAEPLREVLRGLSGEIANVTDSITDLRDRIKQLESVRSELVTAKMKTARASVARDVLGDVEFFACPRCGQDIEQRDVPAGVCRLCGLPEQVQQGPATAVLTRDLDERVDDLKDLIAKHNLQLQAVERDLSVRLRRKRALDAELASELSRYDTAYMSQIRSIERRAAELYERREALERLRKIPAALAELQQHAGRLQGDIDRLRVEIDSERSRLESADTFVRDISDEFLAAMQAIGFPGVGSSDRVVIDTRDWLPYVIHGDQRWSFYDAGSGGKKTLFNVCYAVALHRVAAKRALPLPSFLIIDSPTKNISQDENPALVHQLYEYIYRTVTEYSADLQFVLIDSDFVRPEGDRPWFTHRRMALGEPEAPPLIPYYVGP